MIRLENVEKYCKNYTEIENYDEAMTDTTQTWHCHHRLETHTSDGERRLVELTLKELKALGMYYHRPADELIFLTKSDHSNLHKRSKEAKEKISTANKGRASNRKGKHLSEEQKQKISNALKGRTPSNKGKHMSEEQKRKISEARKAYWAKRNRV